MQKKHLAIIFVIILLLVPALLFVSFGPDEVSGGKDQPSNAWVVRLNNAKYQRSEYLSDKALVVAGYAEDSPELAVAASAAAIYRTGTEMNYEPVMITDSDEEALDRYFQLCDRERTELDFSDVTRASVELAELCWLQSDLIIIYSDYGNGLAAVPLAAYYNIPMVYIKNSTEGLSDLLTKLKCKYAISVGDAPLLSIPTLGISYDSEITLNEFYLWCLVSNGDSSNYAVVTNPMDVFNTWGEDGKIPTAGVSMTAAQVAAYRKAMVYFVDGFRQDQLGIEFDDIVNYNQMGAEIAVANVYANATKQKVYEAKNLTERYGGTLEYLTIVGDPIAVPFYYGFFDPGSGSPKFEGTNYAASDYYYADLEGDEKQDIAYGRILARSLTDTSLLCVRNLGYTEFCELNFEKGNDVSERFYDTFSENWQENAGVFVGTSKPLPMPGALKHMKKFHYDVLSGAGMFVTGEESLKFNDVTAAEMLDKMNYIMYCGHGNYFSWYSNRADYIDAQFINTQKLKPGFAAVMACQTSRTDNLDDPNEMKIAHSYLHAGLSGYIGASRLAYGLFKVGDGEQGMLLDTGALYLVDRITQHFAGGGYTIGELLLLARNDMQDKYDINGGSSEEEEAKITCWEYLLYGDPAWSPVYN